MQQSPGAGPRFGLGPKCRGYEGKQNTRHKHHNLIQNGKLLGKDEVKQSYEHPKQYGTSDGGDQEDFDMKNAAT